MTTTFPYTDTFRGDNRFRDGLIAEAAGTIYLTYAPNQREDGRLTWKTVGEQVEVVVCAFEDHYNTIESVSGDDASVGAFWRRLEHACAIRNKTMKVPWDQLD